MPFNPDLDKMLKQWRCEETGLVVSINQYGDAQPKLQIGPRILKKQDGSDRAPVKAGRLSMEDVLWLYDLMDEIKDTLSELVAPE
jgi:hypothetical protein